MALNLRGHIQGPDCQCPITIFRRIFFSFYGDTLVHPGVCLDCMGKQVTALTDFSLIAALLLHAIKYRDVTKLSKEAFCGDVSKIQWKLDPDVNNILENFNSNLLQVIDLPCAHKEQKSQMGKTARVV